jgi:HEAT repeat protein
MNGLYGGVSSSSAGSQPWHGGLQQVRTENMLEVSPPSLQFLETALLVLALCNFVLGVGMFFLMQVRYSQTLARGTRRLSYASLIVPPYDVESLEGLWAVAPREDRGAIEEVLIGESFFSGEENRAGFLLAVTASSLHAAWIQRLKKGRTLERVRAARLLGYFPHERGVQALAQALGDASAKVALSSVLSLGRLKAGAAVPALVEALPHLPRMIPDITLTAVLASCARNEPKSLTHLLKSADDRMRHIGAWALSEIANASVLPDLGAAAGDSNAEVRAKVARALARISDPQSLQALAVLACDPVWFVRLRALHSLGELGKPEGAGIALAGLDDAVREVSLRAAFALRRIQGMNIDLAVEVLRTKPRGSFESLISEWDRAGFLDALAHDLADAEAAKAEASREFLRVLIGAGITSTLESFVVLYPDAEIRLRLAELLLESPQPEVRAQLVALAQDPRCDPRVVRAIQDSQRVPGAQTPSQAGPS